MAHLELFDLIQASVTAILFIKVRSSHRREFLGSWAAGEACRTAAIFLCLVSAASSPLLGRTILGVGAGLAGMFLLGGSWQLAYLTPLPLFTRRMLRVALPVAGGASAIAMAGAPLLILGVSRLVAASAFGTIQLRSRATSLPALVAMALAAILEIGMGLGAIDLTLSPFRVAAAWTAALLLVAAAIDDEREAAQQATSQAEYLAYHDPLTGLANRALFRDTLIAAIAHSERRGYGLAVLFIDLDRFKQVNDLAGHDAGDQVLRFVSDRMTRCLRREDMIARISGDEFVILVRDAGDDDAALAVGSKLLEALHQPVEAGGREFVLDASIGVAVYPRDGAGQEALLLAADHAMYRAKNSGGRQVRFADPGPHLTLRINSSRTAAESSAP